MTCSAPVSASPQPSPPHRVTTPPTAASTGGPQPTPCPPARSHPPARPYQPRTAGLGDLTAAERAEIDEAVAVVRRHRTVMLGMPRAPAPGQLPDLPHRGAADQGRSA